jgi:hypothetical protein
MRSSLRSLAVGGFLLAVAPLARGQGDTGFLRGEGRLDLAFTYSFESYDHFWVGDHRVKDPGVGEVTRESGNLYVAYGLADSCDAVLNVAYVDAENDGTIQAHDETALQDGTLGVKWRVFEQRFGPGDFSFLAAPSVKIPLTHYSANSITAIGDGQIDYRGRIIAHYRFDNGAFASVETGFDYRTERPANEMPLNVTIGATFFDHVTIAPFYTWTNSFHGIDIGQGDFPATEEDVERVGVSVFVRLDQTFGLTGGWKTTIDGKNTGDLDGWWAGIVLSF